MITTPRRLFPRPVDSLSLTSTREKARIPAWCDRILRKGEILKQINYTTAPLRFSDHRPVYATFQCAVSAVDEVRKESLSREIYAQRRSEVGDTTANARNDDFDDEDMIGYDSIAPELPPASSDRRKWWLDNGERFSGSHLKHLDIANSLCQVFQLDRASSPQTGELCSMWTDPRILSLSPTNQTGKRVVTKLKGAILSDMTDSKIATLTDFRQNPMGVNVCRLTSVGIH